jgi:hypothetical protein
MVLLLIEQSLPSEETICYRQHRTAAPVVDIVVRFQIVSNDDSGLRSNWYAIPYRAEVVR